MQDKHEFGKYQFLSTGEPRNRDKKGKAHLILLWAPKHRCLKNLSVLSHEKSASSTAFN